MGSLTIIKTREQNIFTFCTNWYIDISIIHCNIFKNNMSYQTSATRNHNIHSFIRIQSIN